MIRTASHMKTPKTLYLNEVKSFLATMQHPFDDSQPCRNILDLFALEVHA